MTRKIIAGSPGYSHSSQEKLLKLKQAAFGTTLTLKPDLRLVTASADYEHRSRERPFDTASVERQKPKAVI